MNNANGKPIISIVSPIYKAEKIIETLVSEIEKSMVEIGLTFEIILVDDRSPDDSWLLMKRIASKIENVKVIRLSRNFGQHPAIMAGLSHASGDWVVVMDCDMQDQPKEIARLYSKAIEGFDVVLARREKRKDNFLKKISSKLFRIGFNYLADTKFINEVANFGIYKRKVINSVLSIGDYIKGFPLFVYFVGFSVTTITVEHGARNSGKSSYSFTKLISLAFDVVLSYSYKPLKIFVSIGILISFLSFIIGVLTFVDYLNGNIKVYGYTSLILSIWFLSGIAITVIGVVGLYVGKVFEQTKNRPVFIVDETVNLNN